jgi:hypothetical protein
MPKIQSTDLKKLKKLKGPSKDDSVSLERGMKATKVRGRRDLGRKGDKERGGKHDLVLGG